MTPLRAHSRLSVQGEKLIVLSSSSSRRIIFFVLFVVFTFGMIAGFDPAIDLAGSRLLGTIGYMAVLLVLLGVSAWSKTTRFDAAAGVISTVSTLFGVTLKRGADLQFSQLRALVLQHVQLLKDRDIPFKRSGSGSAINGIFEPRSQLFRLFLDLDDERIRLEESSYREEMETQGKFLADFLGIPLKTEQL
jgi:hypothetical protein